MAVTAILLVLSALWSLSEAQSGDVSATPVFDHYCFPISGAPFSTNSLQPLVTIIYSDMTLTTAPLTLTVSETEPSTGCLDGPANSADVSRVTGAPPPPDATEIRTQSASGSFNPTLTASVTASSSLASIASDEPQNMVSVPETSSLVATGGSTSAVDESAGSFVSSGQATMSSSATGISDNGRPAVSPNPSNINDDGEPAVSPSVSGAGGNGQSPASPGASGSSQLVSGAAPSTSLTGLPTSIGESGAPIPTTATISASGVSSVTDLSPDGPTLTETSLGDKSTSLAGAQASDSVGLYRPTGSLTGPNASNQNGTIALSAPSVDALKLSLFLKNLGVWVFNESRIVELSASNPREDTDDLASLVAAIGVQEQTQLRTLRTLLTQSGYPDVPPCRYDLPSNLTELSFLMVTLKSINLGVFMSMAEAADGPVAILLSSIASVDAKHIALLGDYSHRNASAQSFDTPATPAWAYNIAVEYTQPGSCSVQLPLPLLPKLTINEKTAFHVQPGTNVSVGWDTAAKSALDQVGRRAFVAWVNQVAQPIFTSLTLFDESSGSTIVPSSLSGTAFAVLTTQSELTSISDLTAATLAGPVVVSS